MSVLSADIGWPATRESVLKPKLFKNLITRLSKMSALLSPEITLAAPCELRNRNKIAGPCRLRHNVVELADPHKPILLRHLLGQSTGTKLHFIKTPISLLDGMSMLIKQKTTTEREPSIQASDATSICIFFAPAKQAPQTVSFFALKR